MTIQHSTGAALKLQMVKFADYKIKKTEKKEKINNTGDSADISIRGKLTIKLMSLKQARKNTKEAVAFLEYTDSYLNSTQQYLQKIRVLSLSALNGNKSWSDRGILQAEVSELIDEIDRIASQAEFNEINPINGQFDRGSREASLWFHTGAEYSERQRVFIKTMSSAALGLKEPDGSVISVSTMEKAKDVLGRVDKALETVMKQRDDLAVHRKRFNEIIKKTEEDIKQTEKALAELGYEPDE